MLVVVGPRALLPEALERSAGNKSGVTPEGEVFILSYVQYLHYDPP